MFDHLGGWWGGRGGGGRLLLKRGIYLGGAFIQEFIVLLHHMLDKYNKNEE